MFCTPLQFVVAGLRTQCLLATMYNAVCVRVVCTGVYKTQDTGRNSVAAIYWFISQVIKKDAYEQAVVGDPAVASPDILVIPIAILDKLSDYKFT